MKKLSLSLPKLSVFLLAAVLISGLSCKKSSGDASDGGDYFITFLLDGVSKTFKENDNGRVTTGTTNSILVKASEAADDKINEIELMAGTYSPLKTGIYDNTNGAFTGILYKDEEGGVYNFSQSVIINLEEIANGYLKGTFSGEIKVSRDVTYHFTEGSFKVRRRS